MSRSRHHAENSVTSRKARLEILEDRRLLSGIQTLQVPAYGCPIVTSSPLLAGQGYLIEASGEFDYDTTDIHFADAEWSDPETGAPWVENKGGSIYDDPLDLLVNGGAVDWWGTQDGATFAPHTYSPSHVYRYQIVGTGQPLSFQIADYFDAHPWDNGGSLTVKILPAGLLFFDDFESYEVGVPPAAWTDLYGDGRLYSREEAAAMGVRQYVTDTVHFGPSGQSVHVADHSTQLASALIREFPETAPVVMEYCVMPTDTSRGAAEIRLQRAGQPGSDHSLGWNATHFQIYSGGYWTTRTLLPYTPGKWYYVRRTVDYTAGTGSFYIEEVENPDNNALLEIGPHPSITSVNAVNIGTGVIAPADFHIDNIRVTGPELAPPESPPGDLLVTYHNPAPNSGDEFGVCVAASGDRVLVGAHRDESETGVTDAGAVYVFDKETGAWSATIPDPYPSAGDLFGETIALAGNDFLVGALQHFGHGPGVVHMFDGATLAPKRAFHNPDPDADDRFGQGIVAVGDQVFISAPHDDSAASDAGMVYEFSLETGAFVGELNHSPPSGARFGASLAAVGDKLIVGAPFDDLVAADAGAVHVFSAETRQRLFSIANPSPNAGDSFGRLVAAVGDDILVGAYCDGTDGYLSGAAYLFDGDTGALMHTLENPNAGDRRLFGAEVASVGNNALVAAPGDNTLRSESGAVYLFDSATGELLQEFNNPSPGFQDLFGESVRSAGDDILIGAQRDDTDGGNAGIAYLFQGVGTVTESDWVTVGDPGNAPDDTAYGAVSYEYAIAKYEVTNSEYVSYLNCVAADDTHGVYNSGISGIARSGSPGSYSYSARPGWENRPVNSLNWYDCARFINWLHNGQPTGAQDATTTEDGAYDLSLPGTEICREPDAKFFLPNEDEWYKAAYYKGGATDAGYWEYATQSDTLPDNNPPEADSGNSANYGIISRGPVDVGSYTLSVGPHGTFDQNGNIFEWTETPFVAPDGSLLRGMRGGSWHSSPVNLAASDGSPQPPDKRWTTLGFRVATRPGGLPGLPRFDPEPFPEVPTDRTGLVYIVHGHPSDPTDPEHWTHKMKDAIEISLDETGQAEHWAVIVADWSPIQENWMEFWRGVFGDPAGHEVARLPDPLLDIVEYFGREMGKAIEEVGFNQVHFIAHSAGAWAIDAAADKIKELDDDVVVHSTFLDPYVGLRGVGIEKFGESSDWADHYFAHDFKTGSFWFTEATLAHAHNVDVTLLDPELQVKGPLTWSRHEWPREFYLDTIEYPHWQEDYGFKRSVEAGAALDPVSYPVGNDPVVLGGSYPEPRAELAVREDPVINLQDVPVHTSPTGTIGVTGSILAMTTASPVWVTAELEISEPVNILTFDAEFTSAIGAEGVLVPYWEGQPVNVIDERGVSGGVEEYVCVLPEASSGVYTLGFRLDPYTDAASSVVIDSIRTGYVEVIEKYRPDITSLSVTPMVEENEAVTLAAEFVDPDTLDIHTATVQWGDDTTSPGVLEESEGSGTVEATHVYQDDGVYTVTLLVSDDHGDSHTRSATVTVNNVPPTVSVDGLTAMDEGSLFAGSGSFVDPGADEWTGTVDYGDGTGEEPLILNPDKTFALSHVYADNGVYHVTVEVADDDGGVGTATMTVTVNNVPPTVSVDGPTSIDEGSLLSGCGSFLDPGADEWTATVDYGDGTGEQPLILNPDKTFALSHVYADNGTYTVLVKVTDDDGDSGAGEFVVTVDNRPPVVNAGPDRDVDEGDLVELAPAIFVDAGAADTHEALIQWGDGAVEPGVVDQAAGTVSGSHAYADNGVYTVRVSVTDDDGDSGFDEFIVTVTNRPPVVDAGPDRDVDEGDLVELAPASFVDAGTADTHEALIQWGDGSVEPGVVDKAARTVSGSHAYGYNGVYTVRVSVTDDDGDSGFDEFIVTVSNVAPTITEFNGPDLNLDQNGVPISFSGVRGQTLFFDGSFTDPGFEETLTYCIEWGDGTPDDTGTATIDSPGSPGNPTTGSFEAGHIYTAEGTYTVTVTVTDDDSGAAMVSETMTVAVVSMQQGGNLAIGGTLIDDKIRFIPGSNPDEIEILLDGTSQGVFEPSGRLLAFGQAGDDDIQVAGSISLSAWLYADAGNDRVKGGGGDDALFGGLGNDLVLGQSGRDIVVGGRGADRTVGNADDDILIAGWTLYDYDYEQQAEGILRRDHEAAISAIMEKWMLEADALQRAAIISDPSFAYHLTSGDTVHDDVQQDVLTGSSGVDWFLFDGERDRATDLKDEVFADDLGWILAE